MLLSLPTLGSSSRGDICLCDIRGYSKAALKIRDNSYPFSHGSNISTTPLRQWSFPQCLSFSWTTLWGVSSVPFPFWFPYQLHCKLVSSGISSQSVQIFWYGVLPFWSYLFRSEMTSELITFCHLRCHSSSTALGNGTGYWKPTRRGTDKTPQLSFYSWGCLGCSKMQTSARNF